jgi:hypothetical protein
VVFAWHLVGIGSSRSSQITKRPGPSELVLDFCTHPSGGLRKRYTHAGSHGAGRHIHPLPSIAS